MILKLKKRKEITFQEVEIGQIFKYNDSIFMKVDFENDYICCPRCEEDINIYDQTGDCWAVELSKGSIYAFDTDTWVEPIHGYFIEE